VQRPEVSSAVYIDTFLLRQAASYLSESNSGNVMSIVEEFCIGLQSELDYIAECKNCNRFEDLYGDYEDVTVPRGCEELTRERVLVMEWIKGALLCCSAHYSSVRSKAVSN